MRITDKMMQSVATEGQRKTAERLLRATRTASSGLKVEKPSDNPGAWASAVGRDARDAVLSARRDVAQRSGDELLVAESALGQAGDLLIRARELVVQASNETLSPAMRSALGDEVRSIRSALVGVANTRGSNGYLFGGTRNGVAPVTDGGVFNGNDEELRVDLSDGVSVRTNASGARAFTSLGGVDVFAELANLADAMNRDDLVATRRGLGAIDAMHRQVRSVQVSAGLDAERLRSAGEVLTSALTVSRDLRARDVEGDTVEVYSALTTARDAYTRNVEVTRQILQLSAMQRG